jgi:hypothetical protein
MADADTARRALKLSGRRLVRRADGWRVISGMDRRGRSVMQVANDAALGMLAKGELRAAIGGGYVLAPAEDQAAEPGLRIFVAAGQPRAGASSGGFVALARRAMEGEGPLSIRQASAGLRLVADAEATGRDRGLSMSWEMQVRDHGRRSGGWAGAPPSAREAMRRLRHVQVRAGEQAFALAHAACVEGRPLAWLEVRFGLPSRGGADALVDALEQVANAYEGRATSGPRPRRVFAPAST